jgi:hypothetical protein
VIVSGWEMPLLLRAIVDGRSEAAILGDWPAVRADLLGPASVPAGGDALAAALGRTLDDVRRDWIACDPADWLARNTPYCDLEELRRLAAEPERAVLVTTKEGEFARRILDHWGVRLAAIHGKETSTHKCDNLRALIEDGAAARGRRPRLWFVEDRLETLRHVTTHPDLEDVGLFLAAWGYNTAATREAARRDGRVRLLALADFRAGLAAWRPAPPRP